MNRKHIQRVKKKLRELSSQIVRKEVFRLYKRRVKVGRYKNGKPIYRVKYQCCDCKQLYREHEVEVDHIEEVGTLKVEGPLQKSQYGDCKAAWGPWIERLFCDLSNFQILCIECHQRKTLGFNDYLRYGGELL